MNSIRGAVFALYLTVIGVFSLAPIVVILITSFTAGENISFPPEEFGVRWYVATFESSTIVSVFANSLVLAFGVCILASMLALAAAYAMVRYRWRFEGSIEMLMQSPLLLPAIVLGFGLAQFYAAIGVLDTRTEMLFAHVILTFPYAFRSIMASLRGVDRHLEEAAATLGASVPRRIFRILLPTVKPGLVAGALFAFVISFDNVTVSLWLVSPTFNTFPLWLFSYIQGSASALPTAVASISVLMTMIAVVVIERTVGVTRYLGAAG